MSPNEVKTFRRGNDVKYTFARFKNELATLGWVMEGAEQSAPAPEASEEPKKRGRKPKAAE